MHLAFYKAKGDWINAAIRWRTNGVYSHVEIAFEKLPNGKYLCFSSSEREKGTRYKEIDLEDGKWDLVEMPEFVDVAKVKAFCDAENGKPYDFRAILRFALGIEMFANGIWFCSEFCCAAFQPQGLFTHMTPSRTSPESLAIAAKALRITYA